MSKRQRNTNTAKKTTTTETEYEQQQQRIESSWCQDPGAASWILGLRKHVWRLSLKAKPWQCFGSLMKSISKTAVLCLDVTALAHFVSYKDINKHLETATGQDFFKANSKFYTLSPGEVLWVPYGTMVMPFGLSGTEDIDHIICILIFLRSQLEAMSSASRDKIIEFNRKNIQDNKDDPHFAAELALLEGFVKDK